MNDTKDNLTEVLKHISETIGDKRPDWDLIFKCFNDKLEIEFTDDNKDSTDAFYDAASAVVEPKLPEDLGEWYGEFCNSDKWESTLIANIEVIAGHDTGNWTKVIKAVGVNGY